MFHNHTMPTRPLVERMNSITDNFPHLGLWAQWGQDVLVLCTSDSSGMLKVSNSFFCLHLNFIKACIMN